MQFAEIVRVGSIKIEERTRAFSLYTTKSRRALHLYVIAKFFQGVSDQNENLAGKFCAPPVHKKRGSQIFHLRQAFFIMESLNPLENRFKTPLKTVKFS